MRLGWAREIMEHYATNWACIARWIDESGGDELRAARAAYVKARGYQRPPDPSWESSMIETWADRQARRDRDARAREVLERFIGAIPA